MQAPHTTLVLDRCGERVYQFGMSRLTKAREKAGLTQDQLAEKAGTSQAQIVRLEKGTRKLTREWAIRLSPHVNEYPEVLVFGDRTVPIVGYIGAASEAHFLPTELGRARMPMGGDKNTVAVEVRGDSLGPVENWIAYYDQRREPPTDDMIGELCVVGLADGQVFVKRLQRAREPGLFDLWPAYGQPMQNQKVEWAAVVMALLRPSFARIEPSQEPEASEVRRRKKRPARRKT